MTLALCCLAAQHGHSEVQFTEVLSANAGLDVDDDGDSSDWIELWNNAASAVDLAGWGLSDDPENPFRWVFPQISLEPNARRIIWASGKDRLSPTNPHTNFKLSAEGEVLTLTSSAGKRIDQIRIPPLPANISFGRNPAIADPESWYYFDSPTAGQPNTTPAYRDILEPPIPSRPAGLYSEAFQLTFSHPLPGVRIYYTIDGSRPSTTNLDGTPFQYKNSYPDKPGDPFGGLLTATYRTWEYSEPISITDRAQDPNDLATRSSTWERIPGSSYFVGPYPKGNIFKGRAIRAYAVKPGYLPSAITTHSYFVSREDRSRFTLPILSIAVPEADLFDYERGIYCAGIDFDQWRLAQPDADPIPWRRPANYLRRGSQWEKPVHIEIFDADHGFLLSQDCGMRIHGGDERSYPQKSLRFYADDAYSSQGDFRFPLFRESGGSVHNRHRNDAEVFTKFQVVCGMNYQDVVSQAIMAPAEVGIQRSQPMVEFINGQYWGVVFARDRFDRFHLSKRYGIDPDNVIMLLGPWGDGDSYRVEEGVPEDRKYFQQLFQYAQTNQLSQPDQYRDVENLLDIDSYIDFNIVFVYLNNASWHGNNHFRFWRARKTSGEPFADGKFRLLVWDFDHFVENPAYDNLADAVDPAGGGFFMGFPDRTLLLRALLENTGFRNRMLNRYASHMNTTFRPERLEAIARDEWAKIDQQIDWHLNRWSQPIGRVDVWGQFGRERPAHMRDHLRTHLHAGPDVSFRVETRNLDQGTVEIEGFDPSDIRFSHLPHPFPWDVTYFAGTPVTIEAKPRAGHRFAGWVGLPPGTPQRFTVDPAVLPGRIEATFEPHQTAILAYYWNFGDPENLLSPAAELWRGSLTVDTGATSEFSSGSGQEFRGANARRGDLAGEHLRLDSPLGSRITFLLPTVGLTHPRFLYETRRSSQGAGIQILEYTTDGQTYLQRTNVLVRDTEPELVEVDFSDLPETADNPQFGIRLTFAQGVGGGYGNNRFDNFTLEGEVFPAAHLPPIAAATPSELAVFQGQEFSSWDLSRWIVDARGDPLVFDAEVEESGVTTALIEGQQLRLQGLRPGQTWLSIRARNQGLEPSVRSRIRVTVNPAPHPLRERGFRLAEWSPNAPDGTFPTSMMFLQSRMDDPAAHSPLPDIYHVPAHDEHSDDAGTIGFPYNNTRRTRINGLGAEGLSFINTGRDRDLGGAVLSLDTRGCHHIQVSWTAQIRKGGDQAQGLRLQFRTLPTEEFRDITGFSDVMELKGRLSTEPRDYQMLLPPALEDQRTLQLLWRYYSVGEVTGQRPEIRLDEIEIEPTRIAFGFPPAGSEVAAGELAVSFDVAHPAALPGVLSVNGLAVQTFESIPRWILISLSPGTNLLTLEWTEPEHPAIIHRIQRSVSAVASSEVAFIEPRESHVELDLHNEVNLPLSGIYEDGGWMGYGSKVPGMRVGDPDPAGGIKALFIPGADPEDSPLPASSGIALGRRQPAESGDYLVQAWLRSEGPSLDLRLGLSDQEGAWRAVSADSNWQRFSVAVAYSGVASSGLDRIFEVSETDLGNRGWWVYQPKVYRVHPLNLEVRTSRAPSPGQQLMLLRNGIVQFQTSKASLQTSILPETGDFEFWTALLTSPDGRWLFSSPLTLRVAEKSRVDLTSLSPLRALVRTEVDSIVRLEFSRDLLHWETIGQWTQQAPETLHRLDTWEAGRQGYFRIGVEVRR